MRRRTGLVSVLYRAVRSALVGGFGPGRRGAAPDDDGPDREVPDGGPDAGGSLLGMAPKRTRKNRGSLQNSFAKTLCNYVRWPAERRTGYVFAPLAGRRAAMLL